jgi:two-component system OmpR family response regulator
MAYGLSKKIFIVDDDELLRTMLQDYLTKEIPHQIRQFKTGEECVEHLYENPDIIILDYNLNLYEHDAANGLKILEIIRKKAPKIPVVFLSSQEKYSIALQSVQKGAVQYVMKDEQAFEKIDSMIKQL